MPENEEQAKTVTVQDAKGNDVQVEVGADGVNPVGVNNPPRKSEVGDRRTGFGE